MMRLVNALAPAILACLIAPANADENFRCGKWIASSDLSVPELVAKCGQPAKKTTRVEPVMVRNANNGLMYKSGETTVETWTFDRGTTAPPMVVTIVDGRIKSIERGK